MRVAGYADGPALCAGLATGRTPDVIVTALRDAQGRSLTPLVQRLRARFPAVPVVAYAVLSPQTVGDVVDATRLGIAEVALHGHHDLAAVLQHVASASLSRRVADAAIDAVAGRIAPAALPVVRHCLANAHAVPSVAEIAAALHMSRKTVAERLAGNGLPPASALVSWGRILLAARCFEDPEVPVERTALALGFDSGTGLRHMLARYTGLSAGEIRARSGLAGVLPLFVAALGSAAREGERGAG